MEAPDLGFRLTIPEALHRAVEQWGGRALPWLGSGKPAKLAIEAALAEPARR